MATSNTWVLIPTYNEAENIIDLIEEVLSSVKGISILVVDDNSPDKTAEKIQNIFKNNPKVELLVRYSEPGYGKSVVAGFQKLLQNGVEKIVTMDADWSHDPSSISDLLAGLENFDIAIGSRYKNGVRILNWSIPRMLVSISANKYARFILGLTFSDCTSGFRAYRREVLEKIDWDKVNSTGYALLIELIFRAHKSGASISEVPIIYTERREGQSKMSKKVIWESIWAPFKFRLTI